MTQLSINTIRNVRILLIGILILSYAQNTSAQDTFSKPARKRENLLNQPGPYLKTIYEFQPARYDTLPGSGPDPLLVAKYQDKKLIPLIFDAVFSNRVSVYDPNFWGSVPQFMEKQSFEKIDTIKILEYLDASWDTAFMTDQKGKPDFFLVGHKIPFEEISGLFFFESWWLDQKSNILYKDVHAYIPIREFLAFAYEGYENAELRKRLLFMVIPDRSDGTKKSVKYKPRDFQLLWKDIDYNFKLYNKPYDRYLDREDDFGEISKSEYYSWQYHFFDFYRYFDENLFLEKIITGILSGNVNACQPGKHKISLTRDEFLKLLRNLPDLPEFENFQDIEMIPENYPLSDLNSLVFHEDWYINPENLQIYKDVKGITVNRHENQYDNYTGEFIQGTIKPLFTVWF